MAPTGAATRRANRLWPLAAGLVFGCVWAVLHAPVPPDPNADLYDNLSVARHLVRGEGFLCDLAYPLSFAFPFAARVPQPLIHRPPGQPLLLTLPVLAARGDREAAVRETQRCTSPARPAGRLRRARRAPGRTTRGGGRRGSRCSWRAPCSP